MHKMLNINEGQLVYLHCCLYLYFHIQEIIAKSLPNIFSPVFSTKRYITVFTFVVFDPFWVFVYDVRQWSSFIFHHEYPAPFVEKIVFFFSLCLNGLATLVVIWPYMQGFISGLCSVPCLFVFISVPYCFDYCRFVISF